MVKSDSGCGRVPVQVMPSSQPAPSHEGESLTVLIVDDEPDMRLLVRGFLARAGLHVVEEAIDGLDALRALDELNPPPIPTVVVLDNLMPAMTGLEVAKRILERTPHQHIVLFSAHLNREVEDEAARLGVSACLAKTDLERLPDLISLLAGT
jgi:two-component system, chemotaxis family, chemotaxis protein CheY